ncbi:Pyrimidine-nucleoside phosphorylase [Anatilimnocola aggregata]|uniref:thymidine phosphorylase n=1 Tax=Anatilimnocola aggregata TaxID=2528021 RepID=A0A517Y6S1_9BACT|nr:thymidine phosphorylase [Anatilimnocola aggregata]QDU25929.1 Pyrimidine-nucleoside phosphorylase [Anatilimnocola aggregata]
MNPVVTIANKRDGKELSRAEIAHFIHGFATAKIPEYQMAALAMAIYLQGMTTAETAALTEEMLASGTVMRWHDDGRAVVDKHSTGGIGDKTSLILAPLLACCDLRVPMLSGRGLGATGGTLDKLESIPGFRTDLDRNEIHAIVNRVGCVITGASQEFAPADRKLYALRDVTATVPSIPLITASIMSKKLAEGLDALVLDVKWGSGAFMKTAENARRLAHALVDTGLRMGVKTVGLVTDMNQPLGRMSGNALEVNESLEVLEGKGPADLWQVTEELGIELLLATGRSATRAAAAEMLQGHVQSGRAREKFAEMVHAQGGDLAQARVIAPATEVISERAGYVSAIDAEEFGLAIIELGGGRKLMSDKLDFSTGIEMRVRLGERVERGQPLVKLFAHAGQREHAERMIQRAIRIDEQPASAPTLIVERIPN